MFVCVCICVGVVWEGGVGKSCRWAKSLEPRFEPLFSTLQIKVGAGQLKSKTPQKQALCSLHLI